MIFLLNCLYAVRYLILDLSHYALRPRLLPYCVHTDPVLPNCPSLYKQIIQPQSEDITCNCYDYKASRNRFPLLPSSSLRPSYIHITLAGKYHFPYYLILSHEHRFFFLLLCLISHTACPYSPESLIWSMSFFAAFLTLSCTYLSDHPHQFLSCCSFAIIVSLIPSLVCYN